VHAHAYEWNKMGTSVDLVNAQCIHTHYKYMHYRWWVGEKEKKQLNCIVAMSHWLALLKWGTDLLCLETVTCWVSGRCWFDMLCCHIRLMNELDVLHCCRTHILTCCGSICQVPAACGAAPGMEAVYGRVNSQQQVSHPTSCLLSCSRTQTLCLEY